MVLFQNCVRQLRSPAKMAATVQLHCYWKQLWSRWAITGSWEPLVCNLQSQARTHAVLVIGLYQGGQRTSYIGVFFLLKICNGGNFSNIWQNKTNFYTILTTNLYDKSQTKVGDYADRIYPIELEINDTIDTAMFASNLDQHLKTDSEYCLRTKLYDNKEGFNFYIAYFPFVCNNIPMRPAYGVYFAADSIFLLWYPLLSTAANKEGTEPRVPIVY